MDSTINDQYLNKIYEDLQREQQTLLTQMKNMTGTEERKDKETDLTKQITQINGLLLGCMRLKNLRKKILLKLDS